MGILDKILAAVDNAKKVASSRVKDAAKNPSDFLDMITAQLDEANKKMASGDEEAIIEAALSVGPMGVGKIVRHASPYRFNKFDSSKIGSGQGAQSYGHGIYVAESPAVIAQYEKEFIGKKQSILSSIDNEIQIRKNILSKKDKPVHTREQAAAELKALQLRREATNKELNPTSYEIDIPDSSLSRFLEWDLPLTKQSREVQESLKTLGYDVSSKNLTGKDIILEAARTGDAPAEISSNLVSKGISGVRYLDARSRGIGEGTANFVVFDDSLLNIISSKEIK